MSEELTTRQEIEEFTAWVKADVRNQATPAQKRALQATADSARRWCSTLRILVDESSSDIEIRTTQNAALEKSMDLQDRQRWIGHLGWLQKARKFRSSCQQALQEAEAALRQLTGLTTLTAELITEAAALIPLDHPWHQRHRTYQIIQFGNGK